MVSQAEHAQVRGTIWVRGHNGASRYIQQGDQRSSRTRTTGQGDTGEQGAGQLQESENEDTGERALSLPRELGIPQQRVTFLKGNAGDEVDDISDYEQEEEDVKQEGQEHPKPTEEQKKEMMEVSIDARSRKMQRRQLTEAQVKLLSTEQRALIEKLR